MPDPNPYHPPVDPVVMTLAPAPGPALPSRWRRLAGYLVDAIVVGGLQWILGKAMSLPMGREADISATLLSCLISFGLWLAVNWVFLPAGQTLGKRLLRIRVVTDDGEVVGNRLYLLFRYGVILVFSVIPVLGAVLFLVDACLIFGRQRRCLHDLIARTRVMATI